jgi:MarR family transcriptional regulator, negative regulator of the multidrug operon emrRAB
MEKIDIFDLIERMSALIRSEERRKCTELGLQPVHLQVMDYLSRCNRYSDTPAALANDSWHSFPNLTSAGKKGVY